MKFLNMEKVMTKKIVNNLTLIVTVIIGICSTLLFWLFLFGYSFTVVKLEYNKIGILAWDSLLCLIFFVQHSVMVRKSFRSKLTAIVPKRFHGALYTVASGISMLALVLFWQNFDYALININSVFRWIMHGVFIASMMGIMWGLLSIRSFDAFGIRPIKTYIGVADKQTSQLSIKGPYKWVRHPMYFFIFFQIWIRPDITIERLLFNVFFTVWIVFGTYLEERDMVAEFGETYQNYQLEVPMLIPWKFFK